MQPAIIALLLALLTGLAGCQSPAGNGTARNASSETGSDGGGGGGGGGGGSGGY